MYIIKKVLQTIDAPQNPSSVATNDAGDDGDGDEGIGDGGARVEADVVDGDEKAISHRKGTRRTTTRAP